MTSQESQSKPITERLLPQTSIRFFVLLIGASALGMYTIRSAVEGDQFWAKCVSVILATVIGCFLAYLVLFLLANLFSAVTTTIAELPSVGRPMSAGVSLTEDGDGALTDDDIGAFERSDDRSPGGGES